MTTRGSNFSCCVLLAACAFSASQLAAADKLSDVLRKAKWDGVIGTWVDPETKGKLRKTTYEWKIKDRVIAISSQQDSAEHFSLMGVNGKTGQVFHMSASGDGTSSLGKWEFKDDGDAVLQLLYTTGDGQEGGLSVRHRLEDADSMTMTLELPQPIRWKMIRVKEKK
ncbi:MAG: hypothetical protein N2C14_26920 [Planctomycetales bacterium]